MIIQQLTGGPWKCINEFTGAEIEFVDVTAISRLGTAMNSGVDGLFTQLETGTIFPSCDNPQSVQAVWNDFFVEDDAISIYGYGAAGEAGMEADALVEGATTLAGTVVEDAGIGEWVLLILGLGKWGTNYPYAKSQSDGRQWLYEARKRSPQTST